MRLSTLLRRTGYTAAAGAGAAVVLGAALLGVETLLARRARHNQGGYGPPMRLRLGDDDAVPLRVVMLGDEYAAGVGAADAHDTVGGELASLLSRVRHRVSLTSVAVSGASAGDLQTQVARALLGDVPDVAVILMSGLGETMQPAPPGEAVPRLADAVAKLTRAGTAVVAATCPDLSSLRALAQPLRTVAGWRALRLARAQAPAVREAGGVPVDLAARVGPLFRADEGMLAEGGLHPSAEGYRAMARALYPAVYEAAARARTR